MAMNMFVMIIAQKFVDRNYNGCNDRDSGDDSVSKMVCSGVIT